MNTVLIVSESRYPIKRKRIKQLILKYLANEGIDEAEISVAVVGSRKIKKLNNDFRKLNEETTVLTFGLEEGRYQDSVLPLGDIVISYPQAREIAQDDNSTMDEAIDKLVIHGMNNLMGRYSES